MTLLPWQHEDREVAAGTRCDVAGWGIVSHTGRRPDRLQYVLLPVMDRATCNQRIYHDGTVTERMMCAESHRRDSCKVWGGAGRVDQGPLKRGDPEGEGNRAGPPGGGPHERGGLGEGGALKCGVWRAGA